MDHPLARGRGSRSKRISSLMLRFATDRTDAGCADRGTHGLGSGSPQQRVRTIGPKWMWVAVLTGVTVVLPGPEARGYRFMGDKLVPLAAEAWGWDESVWAPGETLTWVVANDPGWTAPLEHFLGGTFDSVLEGAEDVVPFVSEALGAWSAIATADIRWEVSGVATDLVTAEPNDGRPTVFVSDGSGDEPPLAYAAWRWSRRSGGVEVITDCDVKARIFYERAPGFWDEQDVGDGPPQWMDVLMHEFGHCLGFPHSGAFPGVHGDKDFYGLRSPFGGDPMMSYGLTVRPPPEGGGFGDLVVRDDRVAASLLRPRTGWLAGTGRIAGTVTVADDPAPFVQVFALPIADDVPTGAVGSFTNREGAFVVEGLAPGLYSLWAGPLKQLHAHPAVMYETLDVTEQAVMTPVNVVAGETTDGVRIGLLRMRPEQQAR